MQVFNYVLCVTAKWVHIICGHVGDVMCILRGQADGTLFTRLSLNFFHRRDWACETRRNHGWGFYHHAVNYQAKSEFKSHQIPHPMDIHTNKTTFLHAENTNLAAQWWDCLSTMPVWQPSPHNWNNYYRIQCLHHLGQHFGLIAIKHALAFEQTGDNEESLWQVHNYNNNSRY